MVKRKSLAGTELIVCLNGWTKENLMNHHSIKNGRKPVIVTRRGDKLYVKAIVAGDNFNVGCSIVEINSGMQIACSIPSMKVHESFYNLLPKLCKKGKTSMDEIDRAIYNEPYNADAYVATAKCPFK